MRPPSVLYLPSAFSCRINRLTSTVSWFRRASSFTRLVQTVTAPYETILKVILAPEDPPEGFVQNYTLLVKDRSFANFQKVRAETFPSVLPSPSSSLTPCLFPCSHPQILDFKGTPRKTQTHLLDIFVAVTSVQDDLLESSFLSSLDMDITAPAQSVLMNASASDRALLSPVGSGLNLHALGEEGAGGAGTGGGGKAFGFGGAGGFFRNLRRESGI